MYTTTTVAARRAAHKVCHPTCAHANWADCDRASDSRYIEWQAMQQVILAYNIVVSSRASVFLKDKGTFAQLVQHIAGKSEDIMNDEGNPSQTPFVIKLRAAIARVKAGDLPGYNLYRPAPPAEEEAT